MGPIHVQILKNAKVSTVLILNAFFDATVVHVVRTAQFHFVVKMMESAAMKILFSMELMPMNASVFVTIISQVIFHLLLIYSNVEP